MSGPRVLYYTENYEPGGLVRYLIDFMNAAAETGSTAILVANRNAFTTEDLAHVSPAPLTLVTAPVVTSSLVWNRLARSHPTLRRYATALVSLLDPIFLISNTMLLARIFHQAVPDLVVACNGGHPAARSVLAAVWAARLLGLPSVLLVLSVPVPRRGNRFVRIYEAVLDHLVSAAATRVVGNARTSVDALHSYRGFSSSKLMVIRNGLTFEPAKAERSSGVVSIGFVGRVEEEKGVFVLLDALKMLGPAAKNTAVHIVGSGKDEARLKRAVLESGLGELVSFDGYQSGPIHPVVSRFDILALPSYWEGFPSVVLEGMRAGCAIVATRVGGISEALIHQTNGLLIPPGSPVELSQALSLLITGEKLRRRLGRAARRDFVAHHVITRFDADVQRLIRLLDCSHPGVP